MPYSTPARLHVTTNAFDEGGEIPADFTMEGENISPDIAWTGVPSSVQSFVILMEDVDLPLPKWILPSWVHWVVYKIPSETRSIPKAFLQNGASSSGAKLGKNAFLKQCYSGPCPPFGTHRYYFKVYGLDCLIDIPAHLATKKKIEIAMAGHVIAYGELMGRYSRKNRWPSWGRKSSLSTE